MASEKWGYYLITDTINYVLTWLFIYTTCVRTIAYHSFFHECLIKFYFLLFCWGCNSWMRGTHEFHDYWTTTNSNDPTVYHATSQWVVKSDGFLSFFLNVKKHASPKTNHVSNIKIFHFWTDVVYVCLVILLYAK